jgi:hypothetical protein
VAAATSSALGIGKNDTLQWKLATDMAFSKRVTFHYTAHTQAKRRDYGQENMEGMLRAHAAGQGKRCLLRARVIT